MKDRKITPSEATVQEQREHETRSRAAWLGGLFETGGVMSITLSTQRTPTQTYHYAIPSLGMSDNHGDRLETLKGLFGGSVYTTKKDTNSFLWKLEGPRAAIMASIIKPYAPSRQEIIAAMELWQEATAEERRELAAEMKGQNRFSGISLSDYHTLLDNPEFVAGVLDGRGYLTSSVGRNDRINPSFQISTKNRTLIEALVDKFGGKLIAESYPRILTRGKEEYIKSPSLRWEIWGPKAGNLINSVGKSLVFKHEGLDRIPRSRVL